MDRRREGRRPRGGAAAVGAVLRRGWWTWRGRGCGASGRRDAGSDEEDAALSAFDSLCAGLAKGQYPQLADREDLWRLLVVITTRKVRAQARRGLRQKRGGGRSAPPPISPTP